MLGSTQNRWSRWLAGALVGAACVGLLAGTPAQAVSGGGPVAEGSHSYVAKIEIGNHPDTRRSCTGALVSPRWVITAASCFATPDGRPPVAGVPAQPTTATIGRTNLTTTTGWVLPVVHLVPHPDRNLVLAKLAARLMNVAPVAIASAPVAPGDLLRVAGYGRTATEWVPDVLHTATFTVQASTATTLDIEGDAPGASICKGDVGGPALRETAGRVELVAINHTSWQGGCLAESQTRRTATETRVDDIGGWIRQQVYAPDVNVLRNSKTNLCAAIAGGNPERGEPVIQWHCTAAPDQRWQVLAHGPGIVKLVNNHTGLCLGIGGPTRPEGKGTIQWTCSGARDQQWFLDFDQRGLTRLRNRETNMCLAVGGGLTQPARPIIHWRCGAGLEQHWRL